MIAEARRLGKEKKKKHTAKRNERIISRRRVHPAICISNGPRGRRAASCAYILIKCYARNDAFPRFTRGRKKTRKNRNRRRACDRAKRKCKCASKRESAIGSKYWAWIADEVDNDGRDGMMRIRLPSEEKATRGGWRGGHRSGIFSLLLSLSLMRYEWKIIAALRATKTFALSPSEAHAPATLLHPHPCLKAPLQCPVIWWPCLAVKRQIIRSALIESDSLPFPF